MNAAVFAEWILRNAARVREYAPGGDGTGGRCDCIGLVIGAWRMSGEKWPWVHGSNYAARYLTDDLGYDRPLRLGDLVYKARKPGEACYDLPDRYFDHPDMRDYYHVGVVTQLDPLRITHCTSVSGGIRTDTVRGAWRYSGSFSKLTESGGEPLDLKTVVSANGKPVNLRNSWSMSATVIAKMPVGSTVEVLGYPDGTWANVRYKDKVGYCVAEFLASGEEPGVSERDQAIELLEKAIVLIKGMN